MTQRILYTPDDVAQMLQLSIHTIYAKTSTSNRSKVTVDLPPWIKIGKLVRFPADDLEAWLASKERQHAREA